MNDKCVILNAKKMNFDGKLDFSILSDEEKQRVDAFVKKIDILNIKMVNSYGTAAQKDISAFSSSMLGTVKTKEFGEVGDCLRELQAAINSTAAPQKKGLLGLFRKGKQKASYVIVNYESAETIIKKIEKDLKRHQQALTKDIYMFEQMYDLNLECYKELTMYILAGKKALEIARNTKLAELRNKAELTQDQLDIRICKDYEDACQRFEKRVFDLETTRLISIQMAPQIRLLQNADQQVVDRLRDNVINTIPLWRNQMILALGIEHTTKALDAALASERAFVDVETLCKVNADIITSINEVVKIHEEGAKHRAEAQAEFARSEDDLKQALWEAGAK